MEVSGKSVARGWGCESDCVGGERGDAGAVWADFLAVLPGEGERSGVLYSCDGLHRGIVHTLWVRSLCKAGWSSEPSLQVFAVSMFAKILRKVSAFPVRPGRRGPGGGCWGVVEQFLMLKSCETVDKERGGDGSALHFTRYEPSEQGLQSISLSRFTKRG